MKKLVTLTLLVFGITVLSAQHLHTDTEGIPLPELECPENFVYCFTDYDYFELGPADDFFGQGFELATRFPAGSFSQVRFWGLFFSRIFVKTDAPPVADFRVNIYNSGVDGPGELMASFTFENREADHAEPFQVSDLKGSDELSAFFCMYDLNLPETVHLDDGGYISVTRINNYQDRKDDADENFIFVSVGEFDEKHASSGESFTINWDVLSEVKRMDSHHDQLLPINKNDSDGWEAAPFKPFFALHNPQAVPVGNMAIYFVMFLIAGFSVFYLIRK